MPETKEQIRQIIADNNLNSVADVYSLLKDSFRISFRNLWRQNWMHPSVMKRIRKWTQCYRNRDQVLSQMIVLYGERLTLHLYKEKAGTSHFAKNVPALPYSIGISSIARSTHPYSGRRVWAEPTENFPTADACVVCKKFKKHV